MSIVGFKGPLPAPQCIQRTSWNFPSPIFGIGNGFGDTDAHNFDFAAAQAFAIAAGEQVTQQTSSTATSKTPPAGDILGIVIAICAVILLAGLSLVRFRRRGRRRQHHADVPSSPVDSASHIHAFDTSVTIPHSEISDSRSISKVRRQFLQNELRATQEKMIHIRPDVQSQGPTPGITRVLSAREGSISVTTESANSEAMSQLRERNEALSARIRELEAQMESPWALGLSDEPPPGYSEEEQQ
ncbi:hypothetical protein K438DRAFT_1772282 [Mycena galopus ATCC 62051]|nr:hypothetical protein K438DRAFT_1772282 [Mycena galopus ATCC 62051]